MRSIYKLILVAMIGLAADQALARNQGGYGNRQDPQMTQDGFGQFRGRGKDAAPDQSSAGRDRLRQEWQSMPPEQREQHRKEWLQRLREHDESGSDDAGYGRGYRNRY